MMNNPKLRKVIEEKEEHDARRQFERVMQAQNLSFPYKTLDQKIKEQQQLKENN